MPITVSKDEIKRQQMFINKVKQQCTNTSAAMGKEMLALTETYGCQQNENDTERIRGMLKSCGFGFTDDPMKADLIIYNTCAVRENAEQKVFGRLGILKHIKESRPELIIGICGCMVQQEHITEQIKKKHSHVDLVFGTHALYKFPELLWETMQGKSRVINIEDSEGVIAEGIPVERADANKAWVSIMYGCNNFCTYCIVPYVRGRERSRRPEDILSEIKELVDSGVTEVTLLGQNVNSYGKDLDENIDFSDLLASVDKIQGLRRIRFVTSHPKDFGDKLIQTMADCSNVCHQLHLPFQAGSNAVLKAMNRGYTKEEYLDKIKRLKSKIPGIALSTDVIVGFPTETNEDFEHTLDVLKEVEFDNIFSFIYSRREGTPAAKLDFVLSDEQIHSNFDRLLETQNEISLKKNLAFEGQVVEVLVDGVSKTDPEMLSGRMENTKVVNFKGSKSLCGKYVNVKITKAHTWSLNGEIIERT